MSPNYEISLNRVLRPKLLNNPFASWFFINHDFLVPHTARFDNKNGLPFLVSFLHFKQYVNMFYDELLQD